MRANIVLAGGGVKGAVLAGCVNAAIAKGVMPAGFGGTSAGAIVAFLASIGYRGEELKRLLIDTSLADLLDDGGKAVDGIVRDLGLPDRSHGKGPPRDMPSIGVMLVLLNLVESWAFVRDAATWVARPPRRLLARLPGLEWLRLPPSGDLPRRWTPLRLVRLLLTRRGLHDGDTLRRWLVDRLVDRGIGDRESAEKLTFADMANHREFVPLRVVATDARSRQPVVFGGESHADACVVDAVVASARFPLLFRPAELQGMCLTDGGLSSNLPSFLFEDCHAASGTRTMAFDLVDARSPQPGDARTGNGIEYLLSLGSCAVEASDVLLRRSTAGVEYYPIPVPPGIGVFSFRIDEQARHACYDRGFSEATSRIEKAEWYVRMQFVGEGLQASLIAEHGAPDLFEPILRALMDQIASVSDAEIKGARASIALVVSRGSEIHRIITYSLGMDDAPDGDLELDATAGCSGRAWQECGVAVADVEEGRSRPEDWGMTPGQYAKIPESVRSVISVPIIDDARSAQPGMHPIGTISIDCQTALADTGWMDAADSGGGEKVVDEKIEDVLWAWSRIIHALLIRGT